MNSHFTFFESYYASVKDLDNDTKAEFFDLLFKYALYDTEPENASPVANALFIMAKPNLDKSKARRESGKSGGKQTSSKTKQSESKAKQTSSKSENTSTTCSSDKEKDKDKDKELDKEDIIVNEIADVENSIPLKISEYLLAHILNTNPQFKQPTNLNEWAKDIDLAMRRDGRTETQLIDCINWIYSDQGAFWQKNILSGKKLREKFDQMNMQVITAQPTAKQKKLSSEAQTMVNVMRKRGCSPDEIEAELRKVS